MLERYVNWQGNLENLIDEATKVSESLRLSDEGEITVRMVRDYIQRGILGVVDKAGRELEFTYAHLLRLTLSRVLLRDGWSLRKIAEHFEFSQLSELEDLFPVEDNPALSAVRRLRHSAKRPNRDARTESASAPSPRFGIGKQAARRTSIQQEMRMSLRKLGLPEDGPASEEIILMAVAPWFQILMDKRRLKSLSLEEADDLGKAVTASLTQHILKRGERR